MYKNITKLILMILISGSSQIIAAERIETVLLEGIVTSSSLPEFGVGESLVWEVAIGDKYFDEELCDIYPCAELEMLSGVGNISYGVAGFVIYSISIITLWFVSGMNAGGEDFILDKAARVLAKFSVTKKTANYISNILKK